VDSLLGYKMHFLDNGQVELVSIYEPEQDQAFVFNLKSHDGTIAWRSASGNLQRKHGDTLAQSVQEFGDCVPAFLSQITLNLVKEQHEQAAQRGESLASKGPARAGNVSAIEPQGPLDSEESESISRGLVFDESDSEREDHRMSVDS